MRVENVADHPALVEVIARWHWDEWGHADPGGSLQSWTAGLARRTNRDRVPMTFIAFDDSGAPIGSVTLHTHDMPDRADLRHLTPWIAGTFVVPDKRGEHVGTALMQHAAEEARRLGIQRIYLYTSDARGFYDKVGWTPVQDDFYEGESVTIMSLTLS